MRSLHNHLSRGAPKFRTTVARCCLKVVVGDFVEAVFIWKYNTVFEYMRYMTDGWFQQ